MSVCRSSHGTSSTRPRSTWAACVDPAVQGLDLGRLRRVRHDRASAVEQQRGAEEPGADLLNAPDGGNSICAGGFNPFGLEQFRECLGRLSCDYMHDDGAEHRGSEPDDLPRRRAGRAVHSAGRRREARAARRSSQEHIRLSPGLAACRAEHRGGDRFAADAGRDFRDEFAAQIDVPLLADVPLIHKLNVGAAFRRSDYSTSGSVDSYEGDIRWEPIDAC